MTRQLPPRDLFQRIRRTEDAVRPIKPDVTAWQDLALINGWSDLGSSWSPPAWQISSDGHVHLRGQVGGGTSGTVCAVLPQGAWPEFSLRLATVCAGPAVAHADIDATGNITLVAGSTTWVSLDGLRFVSATQPLPTDLLDGVSPP